jgi:small subunit ribosomal protein S20
MANLKSSKKDIRRIAKRTKANKPFRRNAELLVKKVLKLTTSGKAKEAAELVNSAYKAIDKAAKKNILHKNTAARQKSRIARAVTTK